MVRRLVEEAATIEQEYVVEVEGELSTRGLIHLNQAISYNGRLRPSAKVSWQNETHLRFALKDAQPGQIAKMCENAGLKVHGMKRIRIGRVSMAKLPSGQWRYAAPDERF